MTFKKLIPLALGALVVLSAISSAPAHARDFQRDAIRAAMKKHRDPGLDFPGMIRATNVAELDLARPFTYAELGEIADAVLHAYGGSKLVRRNLNSLLDKVVTGQGPRDISNILVYL